VSPGMTRVEQGRARPKIAVYWTGSCGGCDVAPLEVGEAIVDVLSSVEIVFWPALMDAKRADLEAMAPRSIDVALVNGALRTEENVEMTRILRERAVHLVAFGACASMGGVIGLANLHRREEMLSNALGAGWVRGAPPGGDEDDLPPEVLPRVLPVASAVPVDYIVPGCPPPAQLIGQFFEALLAGDLPPAGHVFAKDKALCDECPREKKDRVLDRFVRPHEITPDPEACLLDQGIICMGPVTRGGCEAACPSAGMPCTGCLGPTAKARDQGPAMVAALGSLVRVGEEGEDAFDAEDAVLKKIADPVGVLFKYGLAETWRKR